MLPHIFAKATQVSLCESSGSWRTWKTDRITPTYLKGPQALPPKTAPSLECGALTKPFVGCRTNKFVCKWFRRCNGVDMKKLELELGEICFSEVQQQALSLHVSFWWSEGCHVASWVECWEWESGAEARMREWVPRGLWHSPVWSLFDELADSV